MGRIILHCDLNNFYASCECMLDPAIRDKPVAVCGSVEARQGIVLAKNYIAKGYGVETAEPVWQALSKCPSLVIVPPHFDLYIKYSKAVKQIYSDYTERVESFGLDECWLDVSGKRIGEKEGYLIAEEIRERVKREVGLTISVGVSFNKIFAKLGSDMKKPDAVTVISEKHFREQIWGLPAHYMMGVGRKTKKLLDKYNIDTIGKIACTPESFFENRIGKVGVQLRKNANGEDTSPVLESEQYLPAKSVGHGMTTPKDLTTYDEVWFLMLDLVQDIGKNLRANHQKALGVSISVRNRKLENKQWQCKLPIPTGSPMNIAKAAYELFLSSYNWKEPIRAVTVSAIDLVPEETPTQLDFFSSTERFERMEKMNECAWRVRDRFGFDSIMPASLLINKRCNVNYINNFASRAVMR